MAGGILSKTLTRWRRSALKRARALIDQSTPGPDWTRQSGVNRRVAELFDLFDATFYLDANADVRGSKADPFVHYLNHGWREGRQPSPWFTEQRYREITGEFSDDISGIEHFLRRGLDEPHVLAAVRRLRQTPPTPPRGGALKPGVSLIGNLRSEIGLGQAARNLAYALDAGRIPASFHPLRLFDRDNDAEFVTKSNDVPDRRANLMVAPMPYLGNPAIELLRGRVNLLVPFWELSRIPDAWLAGLNRFDEIWAPSRFIADAVAAASPRPVTLLSQPVRIPILTETDKPAARPLTILTYLDFDSFPERKNPEAAIAAFRLAFPAANRDVRLIVKTRGIEDRGARQRLERVARADARIALRDETLSRVAMDALVQDCDVFVSLHRSEGFGFGAAEALAAGKAVVATDYSGTTDFVKEATGYPVGYRLQPVGRDHYVDWQDQVWAEPSIDDAARHLRAIAADPTAARHKGAVGRRLMQAEFSPEAAGARLRTLLTERGLLPPLPDLTRN